MGSLENNDLEDFAGRLENQLLEDFWFLPLRTAFSRNSWIPLRAAIWRIWMATGGWLAGHRDPRNPITRPV